MIKDRLRHGNHKTQTRPRQLTKKPRQNPRHAFFPLEQHRDETKTLVGDIQDQDETLWRA